MPEIENKFNGMPDIIYVAFESCNNKLIEYKSRRAVYRKGERIKIKLHQDIIKIIE